MSSNKEEKSQAADKIKAATLTAAKGLSRAQAERAAAAAARNVNAYGQKEEGPSRWQEKKEAKRQMYLMSTEKAVRLGERKDLKSTMGGTSSSQCQKCFQAGHWTYECKNERVYMSRPSRSQQLKNPKLRQKLVASYDLDNSDALEEENGGKKNEKSDSGSSSSSSSSEEESDSVSSYSSSSDSEEDRRRRKKRKSKSKSKKTGKHRSKRYTSSSESDSEDESSSDSESDDRRSRKKSRKHSRKR